MPQLTVSVLNLNQAQLTINVLNKLALLTPNGWEIELIVVDNGSEPAHTQALLNWFKTKGSSFETCLLINSAHNLGAEGGRNLAFKLASHQRILILDNDVILPSAPSWLDKLWAVMDANPRAGVVGPVLVFADLPEWVQAAGIGLTKEGRVGYLKRGEACSTISPQPFAVVASPSACWLLRRTAQQEVGFLSAEYHPVQYEDVDFCLRLGQADWKIICHGDVFIQHIENVTTRNLSDFPFARLTVRNAMRFREKWASLLPQIANLSQEEIYWGPIPKKAN